MRIGVIRLARLEPAPAVPVDEVLMVSFNTESVGILPMHP